MEVLKKNLGELGARKKDFENRTLCKNIKRCGNLSFKKRPKEGEVLFNIFFFQK